MFDYFYDYNSWTLAILSVATGLILFAHGLPKIRDLKKTAANFEAMGFKPGFLWGTIAAVAEFFGGLALVAGFGVSYAALILAVQFAVIMAWRFKRRDPLIGGYELDLLMLAVLLLLAVQGGGSFSLDNFFFSG